MQMYKTVADAKADGFVVKEDAQWYSIAGYTGKETENVEFPSVIEGKPVKYIIRSDSYKRLKNIKLGYKRDTKLNKLHAMVVSPEAFVGCQNLELVDFGPSVTEIRYSAFYNCKNLKTILWGKNTSLICQSAFEGTAIEEIFPDNCIKYISPEAFRFCKHLKRAVLPNVESIEPNAFKYCENLNKVTFSEKTLTNIGDEAFVHTALKDIRIPRTARLGEFALAWNLKLNEVWLYEGIENIPNNLLIGSPKANVCFYT